MNTHKTNTRKNLLGALCFLILPVVASAQEVEVVTTSYFSNALFNTMLAIIILLAILVIALSSVLKNLSSSEMLLNLVRKKDDEKTNSGPKSAALFIFFMLSGLSAFSEEITRKVMDDGRIGGIDQFTFYTMCFIIFLEVIVIAVLISTSKYLLKSQQIAAPARADKPKEKTIFDKLNAAVEIEKEETILLEHDYDGIKELDNDLPPWWKYGFYLTIIVSVIYLINYHVTKTSPLQAEEYAISLKKADADIAEFMKTSASNVDESTVKLLTAPADLASGKDIFISTCAACHGKFGEGTVGPNLTDDYWLHSGGVKDIFKTIKYGWPDKGMKSWKEDFSPMQIAQLASYIKSLRGTNPPKPKDKQGDLYVEESSVVSDSSAVKSDSLKIVTAADTLKK